MSRGKSNICKGTVILVPYSLTFHVLSKHLFLFPIIIFIIITLPLENLPFYPPTERFGGYSDEPGVHPSVPTYVHMYAHLYAHP